MTQGQMFQMSFNVPSEALADVKVGPPQALRSRQGPWLYVFRMQTGGLNVVLASVSALAGDSAPQMEALLCPQYELRVEQDLVRWMVTKHDTVAFPIPGRIQVGR